MATDNSRRKNSYSLQYKILHWLMAIGMILLLIAGQQFNFSLSDHYRLHGLKFHSSIGIVVFIAAILLFSNRFFVRSERPIVNLPALQKKASMIVQLCLYFLAAVVPITGFLSAIYSPNDVFLFGFYDISLATGDTEAAWTSIRALHRWSTRVMAFLLLAHAGAAFYHHFVVKDEVLKAMAPNFKKLSISIRTP